MSKIKFSSVVEVEKDEVKNKGSAFWFGVVAYS